MVSTELTAGKFIVTFPPETIPVPRMEPFMLRQASAPLVLLVMDSCEVPIGTVAGCVAVMASGVAVLTHSDGSPKMCQVFVISTPVEPYTSFMFMHPFS